MSTFAFLPASLADISVLQRLARETWHAHYPGIISIEQIDYMLDRMYGETVIADELTKGVTWELIHADGAPIGFLSHSHERTHHRVNLHKLYVLPAWHGLGVGKAALLRVRQYAIAIHAGAVSLYVNKKNTKAIHAYERAGFQVAESMVNEFGNGFVMDDHRMELRIY